MTLTMPGVADERLARHIAVCDAIASTGGSLRASFDLDANGRTIGRGCSGGQQRKRRCGACGEVGHDVRRCGR